MKIRTIFLFSLIQLPLFALPQDLTVKAGTANYEINNKEASIHCSDQSILHWDSFSIKEKESLIFSLENNNASVLNRVTGNDISQILGKLSANGNLFLINPNGIVIGPDAKIIAASFAAITADVLDEDLLHGDKKTFTASDNGWIEHFGEIEATEGDVVFVSNSITNKGSVSAENGSFIATAAKRIVFEKGKYPHTFTQSEERKSEILLKGSITAKEIDAVSSGPVVLEGDVTCSREQGRVYLYAKDDHLYIDGTITAKGADAYLLGKDVEFGPASIVDVSAEMAGNVFIGGDYKGLNPQIPNAETTNISVGSQIKADGIGTGDGGRVIVWSDKATAFLGEISVRGGDLSGNGGFVEISGSTLAFEGTADCRAPKGEVGTLLLDPKNITIDNAGTSLTMATLPFSSMPSASITLSAASVTNQLGMSSVVLQANTDITVNASVSSTSSALFFQLAAGRSITIASGVNIALDTSTFAGLINAQLGIAAQRDPGFAQFNCQGNITTNGGGIMIAPGSFGGALEGNLVLSGSTLNAGSGVVQITGIGSASGADQPGISMDNSTITGSGTMLITANGGGGSGENAGLFMINGSMISATGTGTLGVTADSKGTQNGDGIKLASSGSATIQTNTGNLTISGGGSPNATTSGKGINIFANGTITSAADLNIVATSTSTTDFALDSAGTISNTGGDITIGATGGLGGCNLGGTVTTSAASDKKIEITGGLTETPANISAGINLTGTLSTTNGATISLLGVGSPSGTSSIGISALNANITSSGGALAFSAFGGGTSSSGEGIFLSDSTINSSGLVSFTAFGSAAGTSSAIIFDDNTNLTVTNGTITFDGRALNTGGDGVVFRNSWSGAIMANGTTSILLQGVSLAGSGVLVLGGTIQVVDGSLIMEGGSVTGLGIGLQNSTIRSTGSGNLTFSAMSSDMQVANGGVVDAQGTGFISASADKNMIFTSTNTNTGLGISNGASTAFILVEAGINVLFGADSGLAALANAGFGDIFVVCDTLFPNSPDMGNGLLFLPNSNTQINTAGGEVRLYTVSPELNVINTSINGQAFTPGAFLQDNAFEQWGVYFPDGTYGGEAFNFYYKISPTVFAQEQGLAIYNVVVTEAQLTDLLPTIYNNSLNIICEQNGNIVDCQNNPFNYFIRRPFFRR